MKHLLILAFTAISMSVFSQTFLFNKLEVYEKDLLKSQSEVNSLLTVKDDKIELKLNKASFEYEIVDGDGIVYILKDKRNKQQILNLEKGVCIISDDKKTIILKKEDNEKKN